MKILKNKYGRVFLVSEPGDTVTIVKEWDGKFKEVMVEFDLDKAVASCSNALLEDIHVLSGSMLQELDFQEDVQKAIKEAEKL